eukprot:COSAG06_NODE_27747_length_587_cov_0.799180_1_plen_98_part_10
MLRTERQAKRHGSWKAPCAATGKLTGEKLRKWERKTAVKDWLVANSQLAAACAALHRVRGQHADPGKFESSEAAEEARKKHTTECRDWVIESMGGRCL